jgi:hypothetical protein
MPGLCILDHNPPEAEPWSMSGAGRITLPESQYRREFRMTSKRRESTAEQAYTNGHGVAAFFPPEADTSNLAPAAGVAGI